jgi:hypothetical protein
MASSGETGKIWDRSALDRMVDQLKVLMMTKPVLEPIPIEYNSYVLHLLEGYAALKQDMTDLAAKHQQTVETIAQNQRTFQAISEEYFERETSFLAEIKRIEVIMSRTSTDGLETVTLARTASLVDRSTKGSGQFRERVHGAVQGRQTGREITPMARLVRE